jgi:hypothetical protein
VINHYQKPIVHYWLLLLMTLRHPEFDYECIFRPFAYTMLAAMVLILVTVFVLGIGQSEGTVLDNSGLAEQCDALRWLGNLGYMLLVASLFSESRWVGCRLGELLEDARLKGRRVKGSRGQTGQADGIEMTPMGKPSKEDSKEGSKEGSNSRESSHASQNSATHTKRSARHSYILSWHFCRCSCSCTAVHLV